MENTLSQITNEFLQSFFAFNPTSASSLGFPGFDSELPNFSKENIETQRNKYKKLLAQIQQKTNSKNLDEKIDFELLDRKLKIQIYYLESQQHFLINPAFYVSLASDSIFSLMMATHRPQNEQVDFILKRLEKFSHFFKQAKGNLEKPVALWTQIALDEAPGAISYLKETVQNYLKINKVKSCETLIAQACEALFDFIEFLKQIKNIQKDFAIGEDRFCFLLKTFHGLDTPAQELRKIGLQQIDLLQQEISDHASQMNGAVSWQALVDDIKKNHPSELELVNAYKTKVAELKKFLIEKNIVTLPPQESLQIMETPDFLKHSIPYAAYNPPGHVCSIRPGNLFCFTPTW